MTKEEYASTQSKLVSLAKEVNELDLDGFLAMIRHSETIAPIIDPVLFRRGSDNLRAIKELATSFLTVKTSFQRLQLAVINTAVHEKPPEDEL